MELTTERLLLRPWRESDAESLYQYAKSHDVGPIAGWPPHKNIEESIAVIKNVFCTQECYAVCLKTDNIAIGCIELKLNGDTDMTERDDECELGYWIGKDFWGQGMIPEAARELIRHGFEDLNMNIIWCGYYKGNTKSERVQQKVGFVYHHVCDHVEVPLMGEIRTGYTNYMTKEQWLKSLKTLVYSSWGAAEAVNFVSNTIITAHKINSKVRAMQKSDYECLKEFLYQAIFVPEGEDVPSRSVINIPEIFIYIENFGDKCGDLGVVAEQNSQVIGAAWTRIIPAYGHIDNNTPELAISILPEFRGYGIGTKLMNKLFELLTQHKYKQTSLSVQKDNAAVRFYQRLGYEIISSRHEDYLMIKVLN